MIKELLHRPIRPVISDGIAILAVALLLLGALKLIALTAITALLFLLLSSWLVVYFRLQYQFLMGMAFILPFSIEYALTDEINLFLPGESMIAIALFILLWEILYKPSFFFNLFSGESRWTIPLILMMLVSLLFSTMKVVSLKFCLINLSYLVIFFLWQKLLFKERPDFMLKLVLLFSFAQLIVLLFSIYQFAAYEFNTVTIKGIFRPFYKDHTIWGATSTLLSVFWLLLAVKTDRYKLKIISFVLGTAFLAGVILSFSRAAILSLVFSGLIGLSFLFHIRIRHLALILVAGCIIIFIYRQPLLDALSSNKNLSHDATASYLERLESSGNISTDISNLERINRWYAGIKMARERPLTGFGPGTYQFQYIPYQHPQLMNRLTVKSYWHIPENSGGTAHSEYVLALSEMGIGGLAALLLLIGRWVWIAFNNQNICKKYRENILIAFTVLSTYLFHGAFNNFLNTDKFAFLFWGFAAWLVAHYELTMKKNNEKPTDETNT